MSRPNGTWSRVDPGRVGMGVLVAALASSLLLPSQDILYVDTRPDLYLNPWGALSDSFSTWVPGTGLGTTNYGMGYLPMALFTSGLHLVGVPDWLVMRLWRVTLMVAAAFGARTLYLRLTHTENARRDRLAALLAAAAYTVNPFVMAGAETTPVMLPYAVLPWLVIALRVAIGGRILAGAAGTGLAAFLIGGINAGVVPVLLLVAVPLIALDSRMREGVPWRRVVIGTLVCLLVALTTSIYWIYGTVVALGQASTVAAATESPDVVASVTSMAEVARGMGHWLQYGGDAHGPYVPSLAGYFTSPVLVLVSFALPVFALVGLAVSRARVRVFAFGLMLVGLVVMMGAYAPDSSTPAGRVWLWLLENEPLTVAFRTTTKAGPVAFLGMALLVGLGIGAAHPRVRVNRPFVAVIALAVLAISSMPALVGKPFTASLDIPGYWHAAAQDLDQRRADDRVWLLPGETNASYRWRRLGVDDFVPSLLERPVVYARSFPSGTAAAVDLMAGIDRSIETGSSPQNFVSVASRYLAASDVVVRNDLLWEDMGLLRPSQMIARTESDEDLSTDAIYGPAGANVVSADSSGDNSAERAEELTLAPVFRYRVSNPGVMVRTQPVDEELIVLGGGDALAPLAWAGLLDGSQPFRFTAAMSDDEVAAAVEAGRRVVLTDSNRRRQANDNRVNRTGPLLSATQRGATIRALGTPVDQTVATYSGIADIEASSSGSVFGPLPNGRPFLAVDGDESTAWTFGDFGGGVGNWITIELEAPVMVDQVELVLGEGEVRIDTAMVTVGASTEPVEFAEENRATVRFDEPVQADRIRVDVLSTTGEGYNQVALAEIGLDGVDATESAQLPVRLQQLSEERPAVASALERAPLDVLFQRSAEEEEVGLSRTFQLPAARSFTFSGQVVAEPGGWVDCHEVGWIDGRPVLARATDEVQRPAQVPGGAQATPRVGLEGCGGTLELAEGEHTFRARPGIELDRVHLASGPRTTRAQPAAAVPLEWTRDSHVIEVKVPPSAESQYLFVAESFDPRWKVEVDGEAVQPALLNGYGIGVPLDAGDEHDVRVWFGPETLYRGLVIFSMSTAVVCGLVLLVTGESRGRRRKE